MPDFYLNTIWSRIYEILAQLRQHFHNRRKLRVWRKIPSLVETCWQERWECMARSTRTVKSLATNPSVSLAMCCRLKSGDLFILSPSLFFTTLCRISHLCSLRKKQKIQIINFSVVQFTSYMSLSNGNMIREMPYQVASSLSKHHRVHLHKLRWHRLLTLTQQGPVFCCATGTLAGSSVHSAAFTQCEEVLSHPQLW